MEFKNVVSLLLLFCTSATGNGASVTSYNTWALDNCHEEKIDLFFVADSSVVCLLDDMKADRQMTFFSKLVDVFSPSSETTLDRLRISLLVASKNNVTNSPVIDPRITFDLYTNKDALKGAIKKEKINFYQNSKPMEAIGTINHMFLPGTVNQVRPEATLVIVMFGGHQNVNISYTPSDLKKQMDMSYDNMNVKLFMILIKDRPPDRIKITTNVAVYKSSQIHEDFVKTMSLLMCKACLGDWFGAGPDTSSVSKAISLSCYKLGHSDKQINWIEASESCGREYSQLASIETYTELLSLTHGLSMKMKELLTSDNFPSSVSVYIGLRRQDSTVGKRFRWVNKHPLVHTQWGHVQPKGGSELGCVVWELSNLTYFFNDSEESLSNETENTFSHAMKGNWATIGCGSAASRFYLCENMVNIPLTSSSRNKKFKLNAPSSESILGAVERGELGLIRSSNNLMSLSSLLKKWKSEGGFGDSYAYNNHNINQTVPLSEIKLYNCEGNDGKLPYTSVCDYSSDCPYTSDEMYCRKCSFNEKECLPSRQCVSQQAWCDLYNDCKDGYDERDCDTCQHGLCADGRCILRNWFADGEIDCTGCDDNITYEMRYVQDNNITHCLFTCNRNKCVYESMLHNDVVDCTGPEGHIDETIGALESTSCYTELDNLTSKFSNWGPKCVYYLDIYGEPLGCRNMRHLLDCENFPCPGGYYKCPGSYCIPTHYIRNNRYDCPHGEDEDFDQQFLQCPFYFICETPSFPRSSYLCLHPDLVCDGRIDCPRGDDELSCNVICMDGFRCLAGTVIVDDAKKTKTVDVSRFIGSDTRYLDLTGINLSHEFPRFLLNSPVNLNHVKMSSCNIVTTLLTVAKCNLGTIRHIDLSYNDITTISSPSIFRCMNNLYLLNLSHNEHLSDFQNIEYEIGKLKILDLSDTGLSSLSQVTFSFLKDLKYLNLRNTRIVDVNFLPTTTIDVLDLRGTKVNNMPYANMFRHVIISFRLHTDSFKLCCPQLHNSSTNLSACQSVKDPFSSCSDLMSNMVLRIILWTAGILAVFGNLAVIIYRLFLDKDIFMMAYGHFVTHLSISDLLMGVYLAIIAAADSLYRDTYIWEEWSWRRSIMCNVAGFLSTLSTEVSTMFIFLITLDRFLVIRYPFGQYRIAGKIITLCCTITWLIGSIIAMLPLLPCFHYLNVYNTNGMCLGLPLTNNPRSGREFAISVFIFFNCFMFITIAFGQLAIYRTISSMRMNQSSLTNSNSRRSQDLAVAKNLSLVAITDFVCWFPVGFMGIMVLCGYHIGADAYAWSAVLILPINSAINPLLYTVPAITRKLGHLRENHSSNRSKQS